jgi:hypothetical protein
VLTAFSMNAEEQARSRDARFRDRRADERFEINAPGGCINCQGAKYPCQIVDVSLSGCCVRAESTFLPGNLAEVEVVLPILGMLLRMVGTTQWITRQNLIGIRFLHANPHSKNQLAGLLTGLVDQSVTEEIKAAMVALARSGTAALDVEIPDEWLRAHGAVPGKPNEIRTQSATEPLPGKPAPHRAGIAPSQNMEAWPAALHLLKDGSRQNGALLSLSRDGCIFHTVSPFAFGLHARVEVDFEMHGLHFLLLGVTEDVREKTHVEIRFLEMSYRKQGELAELIDELKGAEKNPNTSGLPM